MADSDESKYFSDTMRNSLKRSISDFPRTSLTLNDFYPCKKLRKLTPDNKIGIESPDVNRITEQLRRKTFFLNKRDPPNAKKSLFSEASSKLNKGTFPQDSDSCPKNTFRVENVVIPSNYSPGGTVKDRIRLRSPQELPPRFHNLFSFRFFNIMQSSVFDRILNSSKSLVVSSPTGSGKTVVFELAIVREIAENPNGLRKKILYLAPIKALIAEKFREWKVKFEKVGISVLEFTGDFLGHDERQIMEHDLILTTPEKWDVVTRRKTHKLELSLVLIDEVHLLNDNDRGHTLEAVICRIKLIHSECVRFVAVSATIPNGEDIAHWLNKGNYAFFNEDKRPVPLKKIVYAYPKNNAVNDFLFEMRLSYKLANLIRRHSNGKPTLIFTNTRKSAQNTANVLSKDLKLETIQHLSYYAKNVTDAKLKDLLQRGIGYHHAGLELRDRRVIEQMFLQGDLPILVCTTTLAQGVNLPAHLVIIKGTSQLSGGTTKEYDSGQIQQMIGRAGRPQFDTSATALILTQASNQKYYENVVTGHNNIESCLHARLGEHLNTEIVLKNINNKYEAMKWAKITYLYVRVLKNPKSYNILESRQENIETKFEELILRTLNELNEINIISFNKYNGSLSSNIIGGVMSRFNIAFKTMKNLNDTTGEEDIPGILSMFSLSEEYSNFVLRRNEKEVLNKLNKPSKNSGSLKGVKYPFKGKIKTSSMKISVLIQSSLGCLQISDPSLSREASMYINIGQRISKAFMELLWNSCDSNKGSLLINAITLAQCFQSGLWSDSPFVAKQFSRIGITYSTLLADAGFTSFEKILSMNARNIELATNRPPPFGNHVINSAAKMPIYDIVYQEDGKIVIDIKNSYSDEMISGHMVFLVVFKMESDKTKIISKCRITDSRLPYSLYIPQHSLLNTQEIHTKVISSTFCGLDIHQQFLIKAPCTPLRPKPNKVQSDIESSSLNQSFIDKETMKITKNPKITRSKIPNAITFDIDFDESMPDWDNENLLEEMIIEKNSSFKKQSSIDMSISHDSSFNTQSKNTSNVSILTVDSNMSTSGLESREEALDTENEAVKSPFFKSKIFMDISLERRLGLI